MPSFTPHTLYLPLVERWPHEPAAWLTAGEQAELAILSHEGRRRQWLAGRWAAKQLLLSIGEASHRLSDLQILTRDKLGRGNRPRVQINGKAFAGSLSIAHTDRGVMAALTLDQNRSLGIDLVDLTDRVWIESTSARADRNFAELWFTPLERHWIAADPVRRTAALWAVKEAVYKAVQQGESWSPRAISVRPRRIASLTGGFRSFYRGRPIAGLHVEIFQIDGHLAARASVATARASGQPHPSFNTSRKRELTLRQAS